MGLFGFLGEVLTVPLDIATTTVKTAVKVTGAALTLDPDAATKAGDDVLKDMNRKVEKMEEECDE